MEIGFRRQASESRAQVREAFQTHTPSRVEFRIPDTAAHARNFINAVNETAGALQAQFSGDPQEASDGATFQINGERFPVRQAVPGTQFNITV